MLLIITLYYLCNYFTGHTFRRKIWKLPFVSTIFTRNNYLRANNRLLGIYFTLKGIFCKRQTNTDIYLPFEGIDKLSVNISKILRN